MTNHSREPIHIVDGQHACQTAVTKCGFIMSCSIVMLNWFFSPSFNVCPVIVWLFQECALVCHVPPRCALLSGSTSCASGISATHNISQRTTFRDFGAGFFPRTKLFQIPALVNNSVRFFCLSGFVLEKSSYPLARVVS